MATHQQGHTLTVRCQCSHISFQTPTPKPLDIYHCHCTQCRLQSASAFGTSAIYPASGLFPLPETLLSKLKVFDRPTESGGTMRCWFCPECGTRLLHRSYKSDGVTPARDTVSIKGGCIEGLEWNGARHIYTRFAVMELPKDWEQYDRLPPEESDD